MATHVPVNAKVECANGACGEVVTLVFNPLTKKLSNCVVKCDGVEYLVPMEKVTQSSHNKVVLSCTIEELKKMDIFSETRYIPSSGDSVSQYAYYGGMSSSYYVDPYVTPYAMGDMPIEELHIPEGHKAVYRGMATEATDGYIGQIGELVIDPKEGTITHFTLMEGHLLGSKAVTLPVAAAIKIEADTVYLKLSKAEIATLPLLPLKRSYGDTPEGKTVEMVAIRYQTAGEAAEKLKDLQELQRKGGLKIINATIFVRDEQGVLSIHETGDMGPKRGTRFGAVVGGVVGLIAGPAGAVAGALVGGGVGKAAAKRIDVGFNNEFLQVLGEKLKPGQSGLLILIEHEWLEKFTELLAGTEGVFSRQALTDRMVEQMINAQKEE